MQSVVAYYSIQDVSSKIERSVSGVQSRSTDVAGWILSLVGKE